MAKDRRSGKLAIILHADVAESTQLVQKDEHLAHARIREAFNLLGKTIRQFSRRVLELRGDALLADNTVTGAGVVLARRVEQLAVPGGLCITAAIHEALSKPLRMSVTPATSQTRVPAGKPIIGPGLPVPFAEQRGIRCRGP